MGIIHKLKPEVRDFIIEQKSSNPALSCRKLTALILNNYKIDLSKSSINMIIKEAGLSAPVGRTPKKKRHHIVMPKLPVLLEDNSAKEINILEDERLIREAAEAEKLRLAKLEEEKKLQEEALKKTQEEALSEEKTRLAKQERKEEEIRKAQELEEQKIKNETERLRQLQLEEEKRLKEEELKKAQGEESRKAQEEVARKAEEETRKAQEEMARKAEEQTRKAREEELMRQEQDKFRAEEFAKKAAEEEQKKSAEGAPQTTSVFNIGRLPQLEDTGIVFLRAIDSIIGLSKLIAAAIKARLPKSEVNLDDITENIIYLPLLQGKIEKALEDKLNGYLNEVENIKVMGLDITRIMTLGLQEARSVKANLTDGTNLYLDGQFYSVWSSPHIPYDFASPIHSLKKQINKFFGAEEPFILFNAPGYDMPSREFFNFLDSLEAKENSINSLTIYGNKLDELEILPISQAKKRFIIFGVWPWQFVEYRKVKSIGEFRQHHLEEQDKDVFIADIDLELRNSGIGKQVALAGCALKTALSEKTRLIILSNFAPGEKKAEEIASLYLNHWPNLDEAFQDYSRKIELFTYTADSQRFFNAGNMNLGLAQVSSLKDLFNSYLVALDAYARWHFLPSGYEDKEFTITRERFYDLGARLIKGKEHCSAEFILPAAGYSFAKDLAYFCRRMNEREVVLDGKRFLFRA